MPSGKLTRMSMCAVIVHSPAFDWGAIGSGPRLAVGAAIACPDRPVINIQADGSAMCALQALWTQVREELQVVTIICANRTYAILKLELAQQKIPHIGQATKWQALADIGRPCTDWVLLAGDMGVQHAIKFQSSSRSRKLWVDCDAGVDDAQALLLALTAPNVELVGISAVHGNVGMSQVLRNVARVLTLCSRPDIPFYAGADEPLLAYSMDDAHQSQSVFHGNDGLGDAPNAVPTAASVTFSASPGYAYTKMIEAAKAQRGELILVVLGPLTNVALACKLDPQLPSRVKALYVMGGSAHKGNITPTAEFNFHCDPEAAFLVLKKFPQTTLITWDCCMRHATPWIVVDNWFNKDTPRAKFLAATMANSSAYMKRERPQLGGSALPALGCKSVARLFEKRHELMARHRHQRQAAKRRRLSLGVAPVGLLSLPEDVLLHIVYNLDHEDIEPLFQVCQDLRSMMHTAMLLHFSYITPHRQPDEVSARFTVRKRAVSRAQPASSSSSRYHVKASAAPRALQFLDTSEVSSCTEQFGLMGPFASSHADDQ
ncbi:hypothetical protein WJX79_008293 [Trebouxia sp. C0005]